MNDVVIETLNETETNVEAVVDREGLAVADERADASIDTEGTPAEAYVQFEEDIS